MSKSSQRKLSPLSAQEQHEKKVKATKKVAKQSRKANRPKK